MGTERKIIDLPDFLPEFYVVLLGFPLTPAQRVPLGFLFPNAMHMGGWRHMWDLVLRRVLSAIPWWPLFLRHSGHLHWNGYQS